MLKSYAIDSSFKRWRSGAPVYLHHRPEVDVTAQRRQVVSLRPGHGRAAVGKLVDVRDALARVEMTVG